VFDVLFARKTMQKNMHMINDLTPFPAVPRTYGGTSNEVERHHQPMTGARQEAKQRVRNRRAQPTLKISCGPKLGCSTSMRTK